MTTIRFVGAKGDIHELDLPNGISLMQGAVSNGLSGIVGECGGAAMCATCHVYVEDGDLKRLAPRQEIEDEVLDSAAAERRPTSRLSCQIEVTPALAGLTVHMPESQY